MTFKKNNCDLELACFLDLSGFQAGCADFDAPHCAVHIRTHFLKVWQPPARRSVVGVTHIISGDWFFSTNFTNFCHDSLLPLFNKVKKYMNFSAIVQ
jgi:hypothetical protein